jgi:hypothetical protein
MAHGYLGDGYGTHGEIDPDSDEQRERGSRDREWRGGDDWRDRDRARGSMFRDRDAGDRDERWPQDRWPEQRGRADSYNRQAEDWSGQHRFSAHPDDHYRSWRDRHMSELDRDYQDYCREREQQFHQDFDSWRRNRGQQPSSASQANAMTAQAGELELTHERALAGEGTMPSPTDAATLGTNNSENTTTGRGNRQR